MTGHRVIERGAEAVHIGQKSFRLALDFFGRDVIRRAPRHVLHFVFHVGFAGEAEVNQLWFVVRVEQNIARLDVAVEQVVLERHVERGGDFDADVEHVQFLQQA